MKKAKSSSELYKRMKERVEEIKYLAPDCEAAHSEEDSLHKDVLLEISRTSTDPISRKFARLALRTKDIEFERWTG